MPPAATNRLNWPVLIGFWLIVATIYAVRAMYATSTPLFADTDDAMRLVVVRDLLDGQGWYDNLQHRLNTPYGSEMHWSRLVDLPLAAIVAVLRPVAGAAAETILGYLWPALLLFVMLAVGAKLTLHLVGREGLLPALVLPALSPAVMAEFVPGRIDHHSIQIILALTMAYCTVRAVRSPRWAMGAGLAAATAMAIATEAVPAVLATVLGFGLLWVLRRERAGALLMFGLTFALASVVHLAVALPPERWLVPACDTMSIFYAAAAVAVGVTFAILAVLLPLNASGARLAAGLVVGAAAAAVLVFFFRDCLGGPYAAVDPWLVDNWLSRIVEARPAWESLAALPAYTIAIALPPILGLAVIASMVPGAGADRRVEWLMLGLSLAVAVAVMLVQVRGARLAAPLAIPAAAALIAGSRHRFTLDKRLSDALLLVGSWIVFAGIALLVAVNGVGIALTGAPPGSTGEAATAEGKEACLLPSAFDDLRGLPPERIMTPIDLGAHMLMETPHAVVAAPYHRNQQGVRDAFRFFNEPLEDQRAMLAERGIGLVVTCPAMAEMQGGPSTDTASFVALSQAGALPGWLADQSLPGAALKVYAVLPREP